MRKAKQAVAQPDAELHQAIAIYRAGSEAQIALGSTTGADPGFVIREHINQSLEVHWNRIMRKPAETLAGLKAKAQLAVEEDNDTLAMAICRELSIAADVVALP